MNRIAKICSSIFILTLTTIYSQAYAGGDQDNYKDGEELHQNHCLKCHTDSVYTRDDSFIISIRELGKQVRRCKDNAGLPWFDEDTDAVIHFLNKKYYKF